MVIDDRNVVTLPGPVKLSTEWEQDVRQHRACSRPFEQPAEGTLRPWYLTATGHLVALFSDPEETQRAQRGLLQRKVPREELRLYESEEILRILSQLQEERSLVAKAVAALVADPDAKQPFLANAWTGGAALWLVARTRDRADHLVRCATPCQKDGDRPQACPQTMSTINVAPPLVSEGCETVAKGLWQQIRHLLQWPAIDKP